MTEERIERQVERRMNQLDARLMVGVYDQVDYDAEVLKLTRWADEQYKLTTMAKIKQAPTGEIDEEDGAWH